MNVLELGIITAPITGLCAGVNAASGRGPGVVVGCARRGGLLIGAASFCGPVFAADFLLSRVHDPKVLPDRPSIVEWLVGSTGVLLMAASPLVAWLFTSLALSRLLGG